MFYFLLFCVLLGIRESQQDGFRSITTCENDVMILKCDDVSRLFISHSFFGRQNSHKCASGRHNVPHGGCQSQRTIEKIARNCHGRFQCKIRAESASFGDACPGVTKYLHVTYMCVHMKHFIKRRGCHGNSLLLSCPHESKIFLGYTFYGRKNKNICRSSSNETAVTGFHDNHHRVCRADDVYQQAAWKCNRKQRCILHISNMTSHDPCPSMRKYLEIIFTCVLYKGVRTKTACDGNQLQLRCPRHEKILVNSAFYGRNKEQKCMHGNHDVPLDGCSWSGARSLVDNFCNNRQICTLQVGGDKFASAEVCFHNNKYLTVDYSCVKTKTEVICEGNAKWIYCPKDKKIQILSSTFGRTNRNICVTFGSWAPSTGACKSRNSWKVATLHCNGRNSCLLYANVHHFGNPCPGVSKYLAFRFTCI